MCMIKFPIVKGCQDFLVNPDLSDGPGTSHRGIDGSLARSLFTQEAETALCQKATAFGEETVC